MAPARLRAVDLMVAEVVKTFGNCFECKDFFFAAPEPSSVLLL